MNKDSHLYGKATGSGLGGRGMVSGNRQGRATNFMYYAKEYLALFGQTLKIACDSVQSFKSCF